VHRQGRQRTAVRDPGRERVREPFLSLKYRAILVGLLLALLAAADLARPPDRQLSSRALRAGIHVYQHTLSPLLPTFGIRCRFTPTCSRYADVAIARDGALKGSWRAVKRIARCGPWTPAGTVDEP
jgi:putative membrane protein insertion efficiency factor